MVAYSFQRRFIEPIRLAIKTQTIRTVRETRVGRHAQVGDALQLFYGMRTKACEKIADAICTSAVPVEIHRAGRFIRAIKVGGVSLASDDQLEHFARCDGFDDLEDMAAFWDNYHADGPFHGVMIVWKLQVPR